MLFAKEVAFHPTKDLIVGGGLGGANLWKASSGQLTTSLRGKDLDRYYDDVFTETKGLLGRASSGVARGASM